MLFWEKFFHFETKIPASFHDCHQTVFGDRSNVLEECLKWCNDEEDCVVFFRKGRTCSLFDAGILSKDARLKDLDFGRKGMKFFLIWPVKKLEIFIWFLLLPQHCFCSSAWKFLNFEVKYRNETNKLDSSSTDPYVNTKIY
jgi:hypothetical protein